MLPIVEMLSGGAASLQVRRVYLVDFGFWHSRAHLAWPLPGGDPPNPPLKDLEPPITIPEQPDEPSSPGIPRAGCVRGLGGCTVGTIPQTILNPSRNNRPTNPETTSNHPPTGPPSPHSRTHPALGIPGGGGGKLEVMVVVFVVCFRDGWG